MSDAYDFVNNWGNLDNALRRIATRSSAYKDPTERVFSEAEQEEKLKQAKEEFEEELHQKRLEAIRARLQLENRDSWFRTSPYYWMGFSDRRGNPLK
ncbi:unnamed protein product [Gongylonema pulchrum]|uniref:Heparan-sulfate 6-O-sulfotransferase n=1 Tax=Gongylonema pulchrum TaxID=637853 RepID=A0A183E342_9BILA|nr:unnamed protein product [Gongylonema pulchrum]